MKKKNENIIDFYEKIQQENERLEATAKKAKEKISANNKKRSDKLIADLDTLCRASHISMIDVLRLIGAIAASGTNINEIISLISDSGSDNSEPVREAEPIVEEAEETAEAVPVLPAEAE